MTDDLLALRTDVPEIGKLVSASHQDISCPFCERTFAVASRPTTLVASGLAALALHVKSLNECRQHAEDERDRLNDENKRLLDDLRECADVLDGHCESCAKPYMNLALRRGWQPREEER